MSEGAEQHLSREVATHLFAGLIDLILVQSGEVLLDCRIGACSIVHEDLQRRKLVIIVRTVITAKQSFPPSSLSAHRAWRTYETDTTQKGVGGKGGMHEDHALGRSSFS